MGRDYSEILHLVSQFSRAQCCDEVHCVGKEIVPSQCEADARPLGRRASAAD